MKKLSLAIAAMSFTFALCSVADCQDETKPSVEETKSATSNVTATPSLAAPPSIAEYSSDIIELIGNPSVQKDLELVDDQVKKIWAMHSAWGEEAQTSMSDLRSGKITGDEYTKNLIANKLARKVLVDTVLLPHQAKRLQQISVQSQMERSGTAKAISGDQLAKRLNLTEEQQLQLKTRSDEIEKKLAEEIAKLKREAKEDLLSVLTVKQRATLSELTGDAFSTRDADWNEAMNKHRNLKR